jgi:hypothetical protein
MVFELAGVTTNELPAARALRSCLKRSWCDDFIVDGMVKAYGKRTATPALRARLATTISVGFVNNYMYSDEAHTPEHACHEEVGVMALHDGPAADSIILSSLVEAFASSHDRGVVKYGIISILNLLRQHGSASLFTSLEDRVRGLKSRIETRGSASLLPTNVTLRPRSVALLNFVSEFITKASHAARSLPYLTSLEHCEQPLEPLD